MRLGPRREPARRQLADGDDHVRQARRPRRRRVGAVEHDDRRSAERRGRCRARAQGAARRLVRGAPVADPQRPRHLDARELRRLPPRGADDTSGRDHRRAARAVRARGRRRGQGRGLQQRSHAGDRAREHARPRGLHVAGRCRAQGESRRARAPLRLPRPRRRAVHEAFDLALGRRTARSCRGKRFGTRSTTRWKGSTRLVAR